MLESIGYKGARFPPWPDPEGRHKSEVANSVVAGYPRTVVAAISVDRPLVCAMSGWREREEEEELEEANGEDEKTEKQEERCTCYTYVYVCLYVRVNTWMAGKQGKEEEEDEKRRRKKQEGRRKRQEEAKRRGRSISVPYLPRLGPLFRANAWIHNRRKCLSPCVLYPSCFPLFANLFHLVESLLAIGPPSFSFSLPSCLLCEETHERQLSRRWSRLVSPSLLSILLRSTHLLCSSPFSFSLSRSPSLLFYLPFTIVTSVLLSLAFLLPFLLPFFLLVFLLHWYIRSSPIGARRGFGCSQGEKKKRKKAVCVLVSCALHRPSCLNRGARGTDTGVLSTQLINTAEEEAAAGGCAAPERHQGRKDEGRAYKLLHRIVVSLQPVTTRPWHRWNGVCEFSSSLPYPVRVC